VASPYYTVTLVHSRVVYRSGRCALVLMRTQSYGMAPRILNLGAWRAHLHRARHHGGRLSIESFFPAYDATAAAMRDYPLT
jgi:hypothetical protein